MKITAAAFAWPEKKGSKIERPHGVKTYTVIFFRNSVKISIFGKKQTVQPFSFVIYSPDQPQWYQMTEDTVHDWFHFECDDFLYAEQRKIEYGKIYYTKNISRIIDVFKEIRDEFLSENEFSKEYYNLKLNELMYLVSLSTESRQLDDSYKKMEKIQNKMFQNYSEHWTVERMAKEANLSVSRFHRLYKEYFGTTPTESLISYRIKQAQNFLQSGRYTVKEVAEITGYGNEYHFIRQFKKIAGITPAKYGK